GDRSELVRRVAVARELLDLADQVLPLEGLRDGVRGAERAHPVGLRGVEVRGDHQHRDLGARLPEFLEHLRPRHVGHHRVEQDDVRLLGAGIAQALERLKAVGRRDHVVALHLQPSLEHEQHRLGVVGDEQARQVGAPAVVLLAESVRVLWPSLAIGSTKRKVAPSPWVEFAEIAPPWRSTSALAIPSPSPVPPTSSVSPPRALQKRAKTVSSSSSPRPGPLSETAYSISSPTRVAASFTSAPSCAYLFALVRRFASTCAIRSASASTSGRSFSTLTVKL